MDGLIMSFSQATAITTNEAPAPVGPYNQAVLADGWLYCSGQIALNPVNGLLSNDEGIESETKQVLKNIEAILRASGFKPSQVIRTTIYLVDLRDFEKVNRIYSEFFNGGISPARACVQVSALPKGATVEIDCIAWGSRS